MINPKEFIITRKRKKYKFALFANSPLCFELEAWDKNFRPDILEMGAGTALFSVKMAEEFPGKRLVAVDVKADRLQTGARAAEVAKLSHLYFLRARADQLEATLEPASLEAIWVTFPDPFPKERSAKHRLTHRNYLRLYKALLKKDGALYFKTDAKQLFEWSLEQLVTGGWRIVELSFDLHESSLPEAYKIKTTYETRFLSQGLVSYFVKALPPSPRR